MKRRLIILTLLVCQLVVNNVAAQELQAKININSADSDQLQTISGVGPVTAQKIIDTTTKYCGGTGWIVVPDVVL